MLVTLLWRGWTVSRWTWQYDDWMFIELSETMSFGAYLIHDQNGHLMPGGFLLSKLFVELVPLSFTPVVVTVSLGCALNVVVWGRAFELLTHGRTAALVPLALMVLSPVLLAPMQWWAAAVTALPLQIGMGAMVIAACRWAQRRRTLDLLCLGLYFSISLFFWQKSLFAVLPAQFTVVAMSPGIWRSRLRAAVGPGLVLAAIAVPYLWMFKSLTSGVAGIHSVEVTTAGHSPWSLVADVLEGARQVFLPALVGGPWGSMPTDLNVQAGYSQPWTMTAVVLVIVAASLGVVLVRRPSAVWLLAMPVTYVFLVLGVVILTTRSMANFDILRTDRYFSDSISVAALTMCLLLAAAPPAEDKPTRRRVAGPRLVRPLPVALLLVCVSLVVGNLTRFSQAPNHPGREWTQAMRADVTRLSSDRDVHEPLVLANAIAPAEVLSWGEWGDSAQLRQMLVPFSPIVAFDRSTDRLHLVTEGGNIEAATIRELSHSEIGPIEQCGYALKGDERVSVPMSSALFSWPWGLRLNAFSAEGGQVLVTSGQDETLVSLPAGLTSREIEFVGAVSESISLSLTSDAGPVCVTEVVVGALEVS